MKGVHPTLMEALKLGNEFWEIGDEDICAVTTSGAEYTITKDGTISGGSKNIENGELQGAVYRKGGPIRARKVVIGLCIEAYIGDRRITSTPVETINPLTEKGEKQ